MSAPADLQAFITKWELSGAAERATPSTVSTREWSAELPAQAAALAAVLEEMGALFTVANLAAHFTGKATPKRLREMEQLLKTLAAVGRAKEWKGKWAGA